MHQEYNQEIEKLIDIALKEDLLDAGDITSSALINPETTTTGQFILKQRANVAGLPFIEKIFKKIDPKITVIPLVPEGSYQIAGTVILKISGPARGILSGERTALNFLQHATAVATSTAAFVKKLKGLPCKILDTRKTLPGLRALEKYAIQVGGGINHRNSLNHRFHVKRPHIAFFQHHTAHPLKEAIETVKSYNPHIPVEIEIFELNQLREVLNTQVDSIMLHNMRPDEIIDCLKLIRKTDKKVYLESPGAITLETIRSFAETGIDGIAIGGLSDVPRAQIKMTLGIQ